MKTVSITFDDGLVEGARKAVSVMGRHAMPASFYVVTGWVEPVRAPVRDAANLGRSHGTWDFWRDLAAAGHEVGSHTVSHFKAGGPKAALQPWRVASELRQSKADLQREIPQDDFTISMPWNAASPVSDLFVRRTYSACRLGGGDIAYNRLDAFNPYALASWAPGPRHAWEDHVAAIEAIPDGGWLIFGYHSLDGEGWEPITSEFLDQLCGYLADREIEVATVRDVVSRHAARLQRAD
ncbi:MAG: polysaccharide deacetylase family protein [Alphaproteobacteria bacterium]